MKFIRPTTITDAVLLSSTVPETDYPAWNAATAYALSARVISNHAIYERAVAGTSPTPPGSDPINWIAVGPTNRWAMFDQKMGTVTTASETLTVVLSPGRINSLALLGVQASTVTITLQAAGATVYSASLDLDSGNSVGNWYEYFYEPIYQQTEVVITDLLDAALLDVPAYGDGVLTVTLARPGGSVSCALLVAGLVTEIGGTEYGAQISIRDFSRKEADAFGNYSLVQRDYSKQLSLTVQVPRRDVDRVSKEVSRYRASNVVWIGSSEFGALVAYGFLADWSLVIENYAISKFTAKIEGMT